MLKKCIKKEMKLQNSDENIKREQLEDKIILLEKSIKKLDKMQKLPAGNTRLIRKNINKIFSELVKKNIDWKSFITKDNEYMLYVLEYSYKRCRLFHFFDQILRDYYLKYTLKILTEVLIKTLDSYKTINIEEFKEQVLC